MNEFDQNVHGDKEAEEESPGAAGSLTPAEAPSQGGKRQLSLAEQEEAKLIRRLQFMMNMVMGVIAQDNSLSYDDAATMIADARHAALAMFPGKDLAYDLIWRPRFQRLMRERFRLV